ncbi:hypothetical protein GZH53_04135 [Flavihumibacter sp. R14]|nr:hypothetical protein [Flavihumibacter soli]
MINTETKGLDEGTWNEGFPEILVYLDYSYLPLRTFLEVHHIISDAHDFLIRLFDLDKEEIYEWYRFEIKELETGNSSLVKLEFNFHFPEKIKRNSRLMKAVRAFAFIASLFAVIIGGQEIYLNSLKIELEKTKVERTIQPETIKEGKKLNLNIEKLTEPEAQRYIISVRKQLASAVSDNNIRSLQINGNELKRKVQPPASGSFDL